MYDEIRANPEHRLHPYAQCVEAAHEAVAAAQAQRIALLTADRGRVTAISWSRSSDVGDDRVPLNLPSDITFELADSNMRLVLGDVTCFDHQDNDDWCTAYLDHEPLVDLIGARQDAGDLEWRAACIAVLAELTGIAPDQVVGFCWLVQQHVYDQDDADGGRLDLGSLAARQ